MFQDIIKWFISLKSNQLRPQVDIVNEYIVIMIIAENWKCGNIAKEKRSETGTKHQQPQNINFLNPRLV